MKSKEYGYKDLEELGNGKNFNKSELSGVE